MTHKSEVKIELNFVLLILFIISQKLANILSYL